MATEIRFPVEIDAKEAAKELDKLQQKMEKLKESIAKNEAKHSGIAEQLKQVQDEAIQAYDEVEKLKTALSESEAKTSGDNIDPETWLAETQRQEEIKAKLAEQQKILEGKEAAAQKLEEQDAAIVDRLQEQTKELEEQEKAAGELTQKVSENAKAGNIKTSIEEAKNSFKGSLKNIIKLGIGIRALTELFRKLRQYTIEAVRAYAENDPETQKSIDELKLSLAGLKATWGAAFAPILNAVIPALKTLISWITTAVNAIAALFAALSGKSTFKRALTNTGKLSENLSSGAGAAKEMKKQLIGIDTLTVAQDSSSGGGSVGSGSGVDYEEVQISDKILQNLGLIKTLVWAIGAGIAGWAIGKTFGGSLKTCIGLFIMLAGLAAAVKSGIDAWNNGVDWDNLIGMIGGVAVAAIGAAIAFGSIGAAIALIVGGIGMLVVGFREWIAAGELTIQNAALIAAGIMAIGIAISLLTGSWIPLVIAAIAAAGVFLVKFWDDIVAFIDGIVEKVNAFFSNAIQTLSEKGNAFANIFILLYGNIQTIFNGIVGFIKTSLAIIRAVLVTFANIIKGIATGDWASALGTIKGVWGDVWNSIKSMTANVINSILGTVEGFVNGVINGFNNLVSAFSSVLQFFGGGGISWRASSVSIPRLAKGGIVKKGTPFIAGEDGSEAVIPLERNTQWVSMVADGIVDRMTDKFAGLSMKMPAVAMGGVVPPNAFSSGYGYGISPELESKLDALLDRLTARGNEQIKPSDVYLDKRKVGEIMYTYTEERNRGRGK